MLLIAPILRTPKESEMSLSTQVKESVENAASCMRDALAFAARTEHPITITTISDILCRLESLEQVDDLMHQFAKKDDEKTNRYRG
jgi:DNA repair photolyase